MFFLDKLGIMETICNILDNYNFQTPAFTIGLAFLTVLIPIAIAIFGKEEIETLDRNVHLDHIIRAKYFLYIFAAIFLPPAFWPISPIWLKLLEIIIWVIGIFFMTTILIRSYEWIRKDKFDSRYKYLKGLNKEKDLLESWHSFWKQNNMNPATELNFQKLFIGKLNKLISESSFNNNATIAINLLKDFDSLLEKRYPMNLIIGDIFPKILSWHFIALNKEKNALESSFEVMAYEISFTLEQLIRKIELIALKNRLFIHLLRHLRDCANKHKENREFIYNLFSTFFYEFSENASDITDRKSLWRNLPPQWLINEENLKSKDNSVYANAWWKIYWDWALPRIVEAKSEYDELLDEANKTLFSEVEPIIWAKLQIFAFHGGDSEERINYAIQHRQTFGIFFVTPAFVVGEDISPIESEELKRKEKTFRLAKILLGSLYSPDKLEEYISILENITTKDNSSEDYKRKSFIRIFNDMIKYLKGQNTK